MVFIVGIAIVLLAGAGVAINAGASSAHTSQRTAPQPQLLRMLRAAEPPSPVLHQGEFRHTAYQQSAAVGDGIQSTRRISIPYGITTPLLLHDFGQSIRVAGHGGCTEGQQATVQVTLTQTATAALATGQTQDVCTGALQLWSTIAVATTDVHFVAAPARACGVAETRDDETITDRFEWCRDVDLVYGLYLPLTLQN